MFTDILAPFKAAEIFQYNECAAILFIQKASAKQKCQGWKITIPCAICLYEEHFYFRVMQSQTLSI